MKKLGDLLKDERKKQKLELSDIANKTKIGLEKLEAIEQSDYEALPAKVFTRGLIKSYAKQLKLDVEPIISLFEEECGGDEEEQALPIVTPSATVDPPKEEEEKQPALFLFQAPKSFFLLIGFAVTAILCVFIYITLQKISSYEKEEIQDNTELSQLDDFSEKTEEKEEGIPEEEPVVKKEVKKENKKIDAKKSQAQSLKKIAKAEGKKIAATNPPPAKTKPMAIHQDQKLIIEAFEAVRLEIFWSSGKSQVMLLKADETKNIIFKQPIKIHLSDGGVVNVTFNGRDLEVPGTIGKPIELQYP